MENTVNALGLLLDEEVDMLINEAEYENISSESRSAAAGGAAAEPELEPVEQLVRRHQNKVNTYIKIRRRYRYGY